MLNLLLNSNQLCKISMNTCQRFLFRSKPLKFPVFYFHDQFVAKIKKKIYYESLFISIAIIIIFHSSLLEYNLLKV